MRRKESKEEGREIKDNIAEKYSKVSRPISRFSKWISAWMDRILFSQRYGKLVALLLAVFVYAIINIGDSASSLFETKQVYTFKAQTVNVLVNEETYEVSGLPEFSRKTCSAASMHPSPDRRRMPMPVRARPVAMAAILSDMAPPHR